ncbi:uncharacterized protein [Anabrus simplex]|uniref:uncharacterized protein n=1 Tax=Anabrus simplex TaxID=316456 RepID=UPI0034DD1AF3
MAVNNNTEPVTDSKDKVEVLFDKYLILNEELLKCGISVEDLQEICFQGEKLRKPALRSFTCSGGLVMAVTLVAAICVSILLKIPVIDSLMRSTIGTRCILPNNYFVWEATRPETDCNMCKNVNDVLVFENITQNEFKHFAYSSRPMLMKRAALHWPAMNTFNYHFLRNMYESIEGAYESVEEECQILTFKTEFKSLADVFAMPESRVQLLPGEKPWYIGWSNCHPDVLAAMREHYETPSFLPSDAEHARMDYVFIGYDQGAVMHIDYISRLMWQAQIQGHKTWRLVPPPDCDSVCTSLTFHVEPGDIVLVDTRQWYHDTYIDPGELSLTVSSEYG